MTNYFGQPMLVSFKHRVCGFSVQAFGVDSYVLFQSEVDVEGCITIIGGQS